MVFYLSNFMPDEMLIMELLELITSDSESLKMAVSQEIIFIYMTVVNKEFVLQGVSLSFQVSSVGECGNSDKKSILLHT